MLDLAITGGTCVLPSGTTQADIGVAGGRIAVIGAQGSLGDAARTVDASGKVVIRAASIRTFTVCRRSAFPVKPSRNTPIRRHWSAVRRCSAVRRR